MNIYISLSNSLEETQPIQAYRYQDTRHLNFLPNPRLDPRVDYTPVRPIFETLPTCPTTASTPPLTPGLVSPKQNTKSFPSIIFKIAVDSHLSGCRFSYPFYVLIRDSWPLDRNRYRYMRRERNDPRSKVLVPQLTAHVPLFTLSLI